MINVHVFDVYFSPNSYYSHCLLMQDFGIAYKIWSQSNISKIPIKLTAIRCIKLLLHNVHQFVLNNWPITLFTRNDDSREQMKYMYDAEPIFYQTSIMIAFDEKFVSTHLLNWDYRAHISRGFPPSYKQCQLLTVKYRFNLIPVRNTTNNHEDKTYVPKVSYLRLLGLCNVW